MFPKLLNYSMRDRGVLHPGTRIPPPVSSLCTPSSDYLGKQSGHATNLYVEVLKVSHHHGHLCTTRKREMESQDSLAFLSIFALAGELQFLMALCNRVFSQLRGFKVQVDYFLVDYFCYFPIMEINH